MSHVSRTNESWHTYTRHHANCRLPVICPHQLPVIYLLVYMWMSYVTRINEWLSHVTRMNEFCHTYEWGIPLIYMQQKSVAYWNGMEKERKWDGKRMKMGWRKSRSGWRQNWNLSPVEMGWRKNENGLEKEWKWDGERAKIDWGRIEFNRLLKWDGERTKMGCKKNEMGWRKSENRWRQNGNLSPVVRMNHSCHTYEWVMSHEWMCHAPCMNESWHTRIHVYVCAMCICVFIGV